jgi:hypothetical protein
MALSWAGRRQFMIIGGFLGIVLVVVGIFAYPHFTEKPTCSDGKQNGTEQGVDCGGGCSKLCPFQTTGVVVKWARAFSVTDTVASAVAYIENPNIHAAARNVPYEFKIYDENQQFITQRDGVAYIAPNGSSAIFEGGIKVGNRKPAFARFQFTGDPLWVTIDSRAEDIRIVPSDQLVTDADTKPKFTGAITNTSPLYTVSKINVIGILYDANDNAIGASQTYVESIGPKEKQSVYFTWPNAFTGTPVRNEIIPRFDVFATTFH